MFLRLFLLFTIVPLVELTLLIKIGTVFGVFHTVALVVITGVIGAWLARDQGLRVIGELQAALGSGKIPTNQIIEGALVLVSAVLLVTPGVITDIIGFLCVIPNTRKIIRDIFKKSFAEKIREGAYSATHPGESWFYYKSYGAPPPPPPRKLKNDDDNDIIDI